MDKQQKTMLGVGLLAALGIVLLSGSAKAKDKPKRDPFCPLDPQGRQQVWDAELGRCVLLTGPDIPDPGFCPIGTIWDPQKGECVPLTVIPGETACPVGMVWSEGKCIPIVIVEPPGPVGPTEPGNIDDIIKPYPEGGNFYQIQQGNILGWAMSPGTHWNSVVYNLLSRELFLAARQYGGLDDPGAHAFAAQHRGRKAHQNAIYIAIVCSAMNDYAYGTWGYDKAINHPGPHGRAIRLLTQHADNEMRLRQGLQIARTVSIKSPADKGKANSNPVHPATPGGDNTYPLLWMPSMNREMLWATSGAALEIVDYNPPAWITDNGVEDYSGTLQSNKPPFNVFGCGDGQIELE
jgi:hypothetical protein